MSKPVVTGKVAGNVFAIVEAATKVLRKQKQESQVRELRREITETENYNDALGVVQKYVDFETVPSDEEDNSEFEDDIQDIEDEDDEEDFEDDDDDDDFDDDDFDDDDDDDFDDDDEAFKPSRK